MTKKATTPTLLAQISAAGGLPGKQAPVKKTVTWTNPSTEEQHTFDVYVRRAAYAQFKPFLEGQEFDQAKHIALMICDENGLAVFTPDDVLNMENSMVTLLGAVIVEANNWGKKKQDGKTSD